MQKFSDVNELVNTLKPEEPVYCIRPNSIKKSVEFFKNKFPGKVLYAVKTNPDEKVLKIINDSGIQNFDVASINEVKLVRKINTKAKVYFMHTVKSRESIKEAYTKYNVKDFALDTKDELLKILDETNNPTMAIWLGKQLLGQRDKHDIVTEDKSTTRLTDALNIVEKLAKNK